MDWAQNDALFRRELAIGHRHAEAVAARLRCYGLTVDVTPFRMRATFDDRGEFRDELDMFVGKERPCPVDVKSRRERFTCADDYPYPTAFVYTVKGWDTKPRKPLAIVLVSQPTGAMLVVPVSSQSSWGKHHAFDRVRGIEETFYTIPREQLRPLEDLADWLLCREARLALAG